MRFLFGYKIFFLGKPRTFLYYFFFFYVGWIPISFYMGIYVLINEVHVHILQSLLIFFFQRNLKLLYCDNKIWKWKWRWKNETQLMLYFIFGFKEYIAPTRLEFFLVKIKIKSFFLSIYLSKEEQKILMVQCLICSFYVVYFLKHMIAFKIYQFICRT